MRKALTLAVAILCSSASSSFAGRLSPGDIVIFVAFGAGLTWANAVVRV